MRGLLLDTHIWFWHLIGSPRLPSAIRHELQERAADCWLSPISVWELGKLRERKRIQVPDDFRGWLAEGRKRFPCHEAPINSEVALASLELDLATPDPADRFLAATARVFDLELATVDRELVAAEWLPTLSG